MWTYDYKTVGFEALVEGVALPSEPWRKLDLPQLFFVYLRSNRRRPEFEVSVFKSNVWDFYPSVKREAYRFAVTWNMSCGDAQMWKYFMRTVALGNFVVAQLSYPYKKMEAGTNTSDRCSLVSSHTVILSIFFAIIWEILCLDCRRRMPFHY